MAGLLCSLGTLAQDAPRNTQVQVTRQFLAAALRGEPNATKWLAPEQQRTPTLKTALTEVKAAGKRRGTDVELYKLGFVLEDEGVARPFVAYAWAADSALRMKREWLMVMFRDTTARQVLSVELRQER